jgi:CheY-like chemotaxis protein
MSNARTVIPAAGTAESTPSTTAPAPGPLVLLVEDDDCVADVIVHLLVRNGHRVVRASDGAQAAQHFAAHELEVALVFLDCGLPDIDGVSLCRVFRRLAPKLPIILTSGWESGPARAITGEGPTVFLQKPFFPTDVMRAVNAFRAVTA